MKKQYDIICIGAGSGGLNIAGFMNRAGFKVLLIDKSDRSIGGDCLNFGCVPSKALIHAGRVIKEANEAKNFGVETKGKADLKKIKEYVSSKVEHIRTHENADYFRKKGMDVVLGHATFSGSNSVNVNGKKYTGKKIILATGSRPRKLETKGVEHLAYGKNIFDNENIFSLEKLPKKLVVIGGGPIGLEIGQAFNRFGSKVTVVQADSHLLPKEEKEISGILHEELEKEGITFYFNNKPSHITKNKELVVNNKKIPFDALFVSIGRELNLDVDLEKAGIKKDKDGKLIIDNYLRTTNKNVLVCGDIAGGYMFTHTAELHAGVIISNFFSPLKKKINYDNLSWVTYTDPEIATFGLNEKQLMNKNLKYRKITQDFTGDDRAIVDNFTNGKMIMYIDSKNNILGGSMIAKNAGELFQELVLAKSSKLKINALFNKTYPYPTASRINKKLVSNVFAEKLTDKTKKLLKFLYH